MNLQNPRHLELALIAGAVIDDANLRIPEVRALNPGHFRHFPGLWEIIREQAAQGVAPSLTTLAPLIGDPRWPAGMNLTDLIDLQAYSVPPHELPGAARGILTAYRLTQANAAAAELQRILGTPSADHLGAITATHATLTALLGDGTRDGAESVADNTEHAADRILNPTKYRGVTSGLPALDAVIGGWQAGTLNLIAARPSMGKSAITAQFSQAAAFGGPSAPARTLFFTLEDGKTITRMRTLSRLSGVPIQHDREPPTNAAARLAHAREKLNGIRDRWLVDEESTLDGIIAACWRHHAQHPLGLVVIDQLSHIIATAPRQQADSRTQLFGYITKTLKREVAQRLNVPVILASQLSRESVKSADARPDLQHLRDSGELEQDADTVTFIHRPEYYDPEDSPGLAELLVRKNRNGPTKTVTVSANLRIFKFGD